MSETVQVLHVDDQKEFLEISETFLERESSRLEVESASGPEAGLERLDESIDCIVSDYEMPGTDGLEFLSEVREEHPSLPFILFTGKGSEEIASTAISEGVTDYLQKRGGSEQYTVLANRIENAVEQYWASTQLEEKQKRLSLFFEQSALGVIEWDEQFSLVRMNDAATDILGYEQSDLDGQSWERIVPESDVDDVAAVVADLLENRGGFTSTNENVRKDGEHIICEWHNRVITDDDGDVVAVFSQFQDVTERVENRRSLETLIDNVPGLVYRHRNEPGWPLELVRGSCEALTGYTASELQDDITLAEEIIHPEDRQYVRDATADGLKTAGQYELTYRIIRKDGDERRVWEHGKLVDAPTSNEQVLEGILIDVTNFEDANSAK